MTGAASFSARYGHQLAALGHYLYVYGGIDQITGWPRDVWRSSDGATWQQQVATADWSQRNLSTGTVFNNQLWIAAGADPLNFADYNDARLLAHGANWTQATQQAPFAGRYDHAALNANGSAFIHRPIDGAGRNDVWSSSDGVNWTEVTAAAGFGPRYQMASTYFNGNFWLASGWIAPGTQAPADVWSSADGSNSGRSLVNSTAPFVSRFGGQLLQFSAANFGSLAAGSLGTAMTYGRRPTALPGIKRPRRLDSLRGDSNTQPRTK